MLVGVNQGDGTSRRRANGVNVVSTLHGLLRHRGARSTKVRKEVTGGRRGGGDLTIFQGPLLFGLVNNPKIIDACLRLRGLPGPHKVGNPDRCQKADNCHYYHDFPQGKARPGPGTHYVHMFAFLLRRNKANGGFE